MKGEHYPLDFTPGKEFFFFQSMGPKGVFQKAIWFDRLSVDEPVFNLALCVVRGGIFEDDILTNNEDFVKTISSVAKAIKDFFKTYPDAVIQVRALGEKRLRIYNRIFQRKYHELEELYFIEGILQNKREPYQPDRFYDYFEISLGKK